MKSKHKEEEMGEYVMQVKEVQMEWKWHWCLIMINGKWKLDQIQYKEC